MRSKMEILAKEEYNRLYGEKEWYCEKMDTYIDDGWNDVIIRV